MQQFSRSPFDEKPVLKTYQKLLSRQIRNDSGMLSVNNTECEKEKAFCWRKRQYYDRLRNTENCQYGVFLAYAGAAGYGLVDYELYISHEWFSGDYSKLHKECHIPEEKTFLAKNETTMHMFNKALKRSLFQIQWVGYDAGYGYLISSSISPPLK